MPGVRDNFTAATKRKLAERAGFICSFPGCGQSTIGPSDESLEATANIGEACHIAAAASGPGARRYDDGMTSEQRRSIENGIWMCRTHAKLIDSDENSFTPDLLHNWKVLAEQNAKARLEARSLVPGHQLHADEDESESTYQKLTDCMESQISSYLEQPLWQLFFYPAGVSREIFSDVGEIENLVDTAARPHNFPPRRNGSAGTSWGIVNNYYREKWCGTFTGGFLFWIPCQRQQQSFHIEVPVGGLNEAPAGQWIDFEDCIRAVSNFGRFLSRFNEVLPESRDYFVKVQCSGLDGMFLGTGNYTLMLGTNGRAVEPVFKFPRDVTAAALCEDWKAICIQPLKRFFDSFPNDGRPVSVEMIRAWIDKHDA